MQKIDSFNYTDWTKWTYKSTLRRFYKWLSNSEEYPEEVKWIKLKIKNGNHKLPEELLNEEDIKAMIEKADSLRDKALISVLYESGGRIGEIGHHLTIYKTKV